MSVLLLWLLPGCPAPEQVVHDCAEAVGDPAGPSGRNVLVITLDDIGRDMVGVYGLSPDAYTPHFDALAAEGLRFTNAWSNPSCSPSRASLLTGRYPTRTGLGRWINPQGAEYDLELAEVTIPEMLAASPYRYTSAAVGKWHLVSFERDSPTLHPLRQGFACHVGTLANPGNNLGRAEPPGGYYSWEEAWDGALVWNAGYVVSDTTDEALARANALPGPWFLWVAYNGAHVPIHEPPADLLRGPVTGKDARSRTLAMVEATDKELGRLLDGLDPEVRENTTIFLMSDNGTAPDVIDGDPERSKGTVFDGGVNVPFVVAGPGIAPGVTDHFVHFVDLFPTVAELAEVDLADVPGPAGPLRLDGVSFLDLLLDPEAPPAREVLYTEAFLPNGPGPYEWTRQAVRVGDWKLVDDDGVVSLHQYATGQEDEGPDLAADGLTDDEAARLASLEQAKIEVRAPLLADP